MYIKNTPLLWASDNPFNSWYEIHFFSIVFKNGLVLYTYTLKINLIHYNKKKKYIYIYIYIFI